MIKFNDNNIFVGFLKELLSSTPIPTIKIYKNDEDCIKNVIYLKDDYIVKCESEQEIITTKNIDENTWKETIITEIKPPVFKEIQYFKYNTHYNNFTRTFNNKNLIYDKDTHIYLGEYLRYLRDYNKLNLMSMYNCFTDELPRNLNFNVKTPNLDSNGNNIYSQFNSEQANYKYYLIPVKFFEDYMISIDSTLPLEICCCLYGKRHYTLNVNDNLSSLTYQKISSSVFDKPFKYSLLKELKSILNSQTTKYFTMEDYINYERDLKLVIKVSKDSLSSIVVLEGDHNINNGKIFKGKYVKTESKTLPLAGTEGIEINKYDYITDALNTSYSDYKINFKDEDNNFNDLSKLNLPSKSQLTFFNSGITVPFSNRLIEYLLENVVTNNEDISDNIKRIQYNLLNKDKINRKNKSLIEEQKAKKEIGALTYLPSKKGIWDDVYKGCLYSIAKNKNLLQDKFDILGYMDKDVEKALGNEYDIYKED